MPLLFRAFLCARRCPGLRFAHRRATVHAASVKPSTSPSPPPIPPRPPQRPAPFSMHGISWHDPYSWMSNLSDSVSMRHMDVYMEQEDKYAEAVMASTGADRLQRKIQIELAPRMSSDLCTPPVRWGPWLYYRRVQDGKPYPILCRRKAALQEEFISYNAPSAGFDFTSGKRIEQKLLDYNTEAERFGGYSYEELSEVSPDHRFIAYTMYDKEKDSFTLSVRDLSCGTLLDKPRVDGVANLSWAKDGQALLYTVTNSDRRPHRIFCSTLGSTKDDVLILEESDENVYVNIRNTKDFQFITVNIFSSTYSKVYLINAAEPLANMTLVWMCEPHSNCIIEHHRGHLYLFTNAAKEGVPVDSHYLLYTTVETSRSGNWENVFLEEPYISLEDVDFCDTHMALVLKEGKKYRLCSVSMPSLVGAKGPVHLEALNPCFLSLPEHVCQIQSGPNYDYYSSTMRFIISSPVMPDAVVDYHLLNGQWKIVQQQNVILERTKTLYGVGSPGSIKLQTSKSLSVADDADSSDGKWNELNEFYACDYYDVSSEDGVLVPLTVVYSRRHKKEDSPGLLHGHGAYGELLDKRWRSELKSLLDRGWVVAYADMPDAVVDYHLLNGQWKIVQQQNVILERTKTLYGVGSPGSIKPQTSKSLSVADDADSSDGKWNELNEFYACDYYDVSSEDGVLVPLTVVYSRRHKKEDSPGLLHGHGAYGELLDKRWRSELKSLLDRGWVVAYADVRGGGGGGRKWHHDGRRLKKQNSIADYISCSEFLTKEGIVHKNKLAGWGYSAGGLLVAAAINVRPELFRAAILKAPFLDAINTLLHPILPLYPVDYEEFGYPVDLEDFLAIQKYSPYENIQKDVLYPSVLVTSSFNTRFGVWEAAKWAARVRELTTYDPMRAVVLNFTEHLVEDSKYLQNKELAMEVAFLIKMVANP